MISNKEYIERKCSKAPKETYPDIYSIYYLVGSKSVNAGTYVDKGLAHLIMFFKSRKQVSGFDVLSTMSMQIHTVHVVR